MPTDPARLTPLQRRALRDNEVLRIPAAIDIRGATAPIREFNVDVDQGAVRDVEAVFERFDPDDAAALLSYGARILSYWDGDPAVAEGLAIPFADARWRLLPIPPDGPPAVMLVYGTSYWDDRVTIVGAYDGDSTDLEAAAYAADIVTRYGT